MAEQTYQVKTGEIDPATGERKVITRTVKEGGEIIEDGKSTGKFVSGGDLFLPSSTPAPTPEPTPDPGRFPTVAEIEASRTSVAPGKPTIVQTKDPRTGIVSTVDLATQQSIAVSPAEIKRVEKIRAVQAARARQDKEIIAPVEQAKPGVIGRTRERVRERIQETKIVKELKEVPAVQKAIETRQAFINQKSDFLNRWDAAIQKRQERFETQTRPGVARVRSTFEVITPSKFDLAAPVRGAPSMFKPFKSEETVFGFGKPTEERRIPSQFAVDFATQTTEGLIRLPQAAEQVAFKSLVISDTLRRGDAQRLAELRRASKVATVKTVKGFDPTTREGRLKLGTAAVGAAFVAAPKVAASKVQVKGASKAQTARLKIIEREPTFKGEGFKVAELDPVVLSRTPLGARSAKIEGGAISGTKQVAFFTRGKEVFRVESKATSIQFKDLSGKQFQQAKIVGEISKLKKGKFQPVGRTIAKTELDVAQTPKSIIVARGKFAQEVLTPKKTVARTGTLDVVGKVKTQPIFKKTTVEQTTEKGFTATRIARDSKTKIGTQEVTKLKTVAKVSPEKSIKTGKFDPGRLDVSKQFKPKVSFIERSKTVRTAEITQKPFKIVKTDFGRVRIESPTPKTVTFFKTKSFVEQTKGLSKFKAIAPKRVSEIGSDVVSKSKITPARQSVKIISDRGLTVEFKPVVRPAPRVEGGLTTKPLVTISKVVKETKPKTIVDTGLVQARIAVESLPKTARVRPEVFAVGAVSVQSKKTILKEPKPEPRVLSRVEPTRQVQKPVVLSKSRFDLIVSRKQDSGIGQVSKVSSSSLQKIDPVVETITSQPQAQEQRPVQRTTVALESLQSKQQVALLPTLPLLPSAGFKGGFKLPRLRSDNSSRKFQVEVRREGVFRRVTSAPVSLERARRTAFKSIGESAARSFRLLDEGGRVITDIQFNGRVRKSKKERGVFIEKTKFAINTPGELRDITFKPRSRL